LKPRRKTEGFNLAFLDIMSCGLGAIILVFMLVKQNIDKSAIEIELLESDLTRLQQKERQILEELSTVQELTQSEKERVKALQAKISQIQNELSSEQANATQTKAQLSAIKKTIENTKVAKKSDVVEDKQVGEEEYLMGLKVEGRRIALLVDSSASMTDEKLIKIIRRKNLSDKDKKRGPKWVRTKKIVHWLMARLPKTGQVSVIAFNKKAITLGGTGWLNSRDPNALSKVLAELNGLVPEGSTNLQKGLNMAIKLKPTDLYVITDGLPTTGQSSYRSLNPFASCSSLLGRGANISGECRVKLFRQTVKDSAPNRGVKVNVILLPIEGDPDASPEYWQWASSTGGLMISPADSWP
jgi:hypothetical protein